MRNLSSIIFFSLCFFSLRVLALDVPPNPSGRVNDYAGLLSSSTKRVLESNLADFEKQDGVQVVVAIFKSLEDESLEDFSIRLAETWQIGRRGSDSGVILLIFKDDRKMRIEVGYGLEDKVTDAIASQIINSIIRPEFRSGDYDQGAIQGVTAIFSAIEGRPITFSSAQQSSGHRGRSRTSNPFFILFVVVFVILKALFFPSSRRYSRSGFRVGGFSGGGGFGGGGFSGGGGHFGGGGASGGW